MRAFDAQTTTGREADALSQLATLKSHPPGDDAALSRAIDALIPPFPLKIQIQTHTRCNARCGMCPYPQITSEDGFTHHRMGEPLYRSILNQLVGQGVERLSLFLMNEPLLDRRMPQWLALAREALPDVTLNLFSNGSPLKARLARQLAEAGLNELCISVHGFDKKTYERVMGLSFDRATQNLREVIELKEQGALGDMKLKLVSGDLPELTDSLSAAPDALRALTLTKGFSNERAVSEVQGDLPSSAPTGCGPGLCQRPFVKLYILSDGSCVLCNADWRRQVILGRIGDGSTIKDIWQSARYAALRRMQIRGAFTDGHPCSRCDYPEIVGAA